MFCDIAAAEFSPERVAQIDSEQRMIRFERFTQACVIGIGVNRKSDIAVDQTLRTPLAWKAHAAAQMLKKPSLKGIQRNHAQTARIGCPMASPMRRAWSSSTTSSANGGI